MTSILRTTVRVGLASLAAAAAVGALAAPAHAAGNTSAFKSGNTLFVNAAAGTTNNIKLERSINGQFYNISDAGGFNVGAGCQSTGQRSVMCAAAGISEIRINAGDLDDRIELNTATFAVVLGSSGNDTIVSKHINSQARLNGNDGNDTIIGADFDKLFGQNDHDTLSGGRLLNGGSGNDSCSGWAATTVWSAGRAPIISTAAPASTICALRARPRSPARRSRSDDRRARAARANPARTDYFSASFLASAAKRSL